MSRKVAIVTDSTAYLDPIEAKELGIHIVPLRIKIGETQFDEGVTIDTTSLFRKVAPTGPFPVSLPPKPSTFERVYTEVHREEFDLILSIHTSTFLSNTLTQARLGAEALRGRCNIEIINSMTTSFGLGVLAKYAARAANDGASLDEIVRIVRGMIPHVYLVFYVETMDYLRRSKRIGHAQAILGSMLDIKPILLMEDGDILPLEKVESTERALDKLYEFVNEFDTIEEIAIIQSKENPIEDALMLQNRLEQNIPDISFPIIQYGPDFASRVGPNAVGVVVYEGITF